MAAFSKYIPLIILPVALVVGLGGCSAPLEEGEVSDSNSSSETGSYFNIAYDGTYSHSASVVIGQSGFTSDLEGTTLNRLTTPYANPTVVDGMLYLPDWGNNRALAYNSVPTSNGAYADFIVGRGIEGDSAYENSGAQTLTAAKGKLFLTDWGNSRVLIYNHLPISSPAVADLVVGQTSFDRNSSGLADNRLNLPESLYVVDDKLIVADSGNNRVLIWNAIPTADGVAADIVLGQSDFISNDVVDPPTASSLNFPTAVWSDGTYLVVLDAGNNRVLVWNSLAALTNGKAADAVLGQEDFTSNLANQGLGTPSEYTLSFSTDGGGLYSNGVQLFVADSGNHRVLVWDFPLTVTFDQAADSLIGQSDFDRSGVNRETGTPADDAFSNPTGVYQFYDKLIVTDTGNNRYLIFNSAP